MTEPKPRKTPAKKAVAKKVAEPKPVKAVAKKATPKPVKAVAKKVPAAPAQTPVKAAATPAKAAPKSEAIPGYPDGPVVVEGRVLDRIPQLDPRSRNFTIQEFLREATPSRPPKHKSWRIGETLDQGREGACVGFAMAHRLSSGPIMNQSIDNNYARQLYRRAQDLDGQDWPEGSSVIAGVKAAQEAGYIGAYRHIGAGSGMVVEDIIETLGYVGPINFGLPWSRSMMTPRPSGLMEVDMGALVGGHAILARSIYLGVTPSGESGKMDLVGFQNSWGDDWGRDGVCYIKLEDVERLMSHWGEGIVITKENRVTR